MLNENALQRITQILDDIRHYKGRQWETTSCALLLMAACFGISESIKLPSIEYAVALMAFVLVINTMGIVMIYRMYSDILDCRLWLLRAVDKLPEGDDRIIWNRDKIARLRGGDVTLYLAVVVFAAVSLLAWTMCSADKYGVEMWMRWLAAALNSVPMAVAILAVRYAKPMKFREALKTYLDSIK